MGGGVMCRGTLLPLLRQQTLELLGNYVRAPQILQRIDDYIVAPWLGGHAGVLGALAIWQAALRFKARFLFERPDAFWIAPRKTGAVLQAAE